MIFWEYIKGLNKSNSEGSQTFFSFLKWPKSDGNIVYYTSTKQQLDNTATWQGILQTSKNVLFIEREKGSIKTDAENFNNIVWNEGTSHACWYIACNHEDEQGNRERLHFVHQTGTASNDTNKDVFILSDKEIYARRNFRIAGDLEISKHTDSNGYGNVKLNDGNLTLNKGNLTLSKGNLTLSEGHVEAQYFNATSDIRAKYGILGLQDFNAADYLNNLPVYYFRYINNDEPSIGIMAQHIINKPIKDFNFVNNQEATGQYNDYMSIKEDKLVYVCIKAIQELNNEIHYLKEKIRIIEENAK